jgi:hypothetical protein
MERPEDVQRARWLAQAGASKEVIQRELVKMGASSEVAGRLAARVRRRLRMRRAAPYFFAAIVVTGVLYALLGWGGAVVALLVSVPAIARMYLQDKRTGTPPETAPWTREVLSDELRRRPDS